MTGSAGQLRVPARSLRELQLPIPPLVEQRAIAEKIEALFSELDKGVELLQTVREQLKRYRQAVLKAAFEGKLTAQWRAEQQRAGALPSAAELLDQIKAEREKRYREQLAEWEQAVKDWEAAGKPGKKPRKPAKPKELPPLTEDERAELPELSEGWMWVTIPWLLSFQKKPMTTGPFGTLLKKRDHRTAGVPVLGIENIGNGAFIPGNKIFVTADKANELKSFQVSPGDIIISRSGTVGEICRVPDNLHNALISTNLIRVSPNQVALRPELFVLMFQEGSGIKKQVERLCKGSTRAFLNQSILKSLAFPIPSRTEQDLILAELESRFTVLDNLEHTVETALQQAESLRQSILKKAFEGRLLNAAELEQVRQHPDYEPADKLLERIRAEQAGAGKPAAARKRNVPSRRIAVLSPGERREQTAYAAYAVRRLSSHWTFGRT